jgi:hypothetical protein
MILNDKQFNELWYEITLIFVSFRESEEELELLKKEPIIKVNDSESEKKEQNESKAKAKQLKLVDKYFEFLIEFFIN